MRPLPRATCGRAATRPRGNVSPNSCAAQLLLLAAAIAGGAALSGPSAAHRAVRRPAAALPVATVRSVGGLPAHIAGAFEELASCQQSPAGAYFVFDRRAHAVFRVAARAGTAPKKIVGVGAEPGRVLRPSRFDFAPDETFVIADAPFGTQRVQIFFETGARLGGFSFPDTDAPLITAQGLVVSGVGSLEYTGKSIFVSQPETGALVSEYTLDGRPARSFGELRATGQEQDRDVHLALNVGRVVVNPQGGFYYVFLAGEPVFRKYDVAGKLVFERHIHGVELDEYVGALPTTWPKRRGGSGEVPLVMQTVRTAEADTGGNLWISLAVPYTYVYDSDGDKARALQFRAAGVVAPVEFFFTRDGRVLVTPGCHAFPAQ